MNAVRYFSRKSFGKNGGVLEEKVDVVECPCPCMKGKVCVHPSTGSIKIIIDGKTVYDSEA